MEEFSIDEIKEEIKGKNNVEIVDMITHSFNLYSDTFMESLKEKNPLVSVVHGEMIVKYKCGFDTILKTIRMAFDPESTDADVVKEYAHSTVAEVLMPHNDPDNAIKIDENQHMHKFGDAVRLTKDGKGRMDLIPKEAVDYIIEKVYEFFANDDSEDIYGSKESLLRGVFLDNIPERAEAVVEELTSMLYAKNAMVSTDETGMTTFHISDYETFLSAFAAMLIDLSKHYENGAKHYGVDNWKRGIPIVSDKEGGSFTDSMMRHTMQFLSATNGFMDTDKGVFISYSGETHFEADTLLFDTNDRQFYKYNPIDPDNMYIKEEPHHLAALWNAFGILWTVSQRNK